MYTGVIGYIVYNIIANFKHLSIKSKSYRLLIRDGRLFSIVRRFGGDKFPHDMSRIYHSKANVCSKVLFKPV